MNNNRELQYDFSGLPDVEVEAKPLQAQIVRATCTRGLEPVGVGGGVQETGAGMNIEDDQR